MKKLLTLMPLLLCAACSGPDTPAGTDTSTRSYKPIGLTQSPEDLVAGEVMAVAYSGYREGPRAARDLVTRRSQ